MQSQQDNADTASADERVEDSALLAAAERGRRCWRQFFALDAALHEESKIRLLTPEGRVLLHLHLSGPVPVSAAMHAAGTSYRGFYAVLGRLKHAGLVATVRDVKDQRVRRLSIDPATRLSQAEW